jgi:hypothetical protein
MGGVVWIVLFVDGAHDNKLLSSVDIQPHNVGVRRLV